MQGAYPARSPPLADPPRRIAGGGQAPDEKEKLKMKSIPKLSCRADFGEASARLRRAQSSRSVEPEGNRAAGSAVETFYSYYESPVGPLLLTSEDSSLTGLHFVKGKPQPVPDSILDEAAAPFPEAIEQLEEYFRGERSKFGIPLRLKGTEFEVRAWQALSSIPFGETISYKEQAQRIGSVPRAVGLANGRNPVAIIVPCHRVIGADGKLVGYGGGIERKRALLEFEATVRDFGPQPMGRK